MKLLLTSAGLTNKSIADSLEELLGIPANETKVGFVPTAVNPEGGNKDWFINQFIDLQKFGFQDIDIIDPSAAEVDWRTRLSTVHVIFVSGGNTFHLLDQVRKTGLDKWLTENLGDKVYLGVSAGTIIATPTIEVASIPPGDENLLGLTDLTGFNWVNFEIEPHCDEARFATIEQYAASRPHPVYAIDDQTAIKVVDGQVEIISEGKWRLYE